jgi:hypothetical protein
MYDPLVVDVFIELHPHWLHINYGEAVTTNTNALSLRLSLPGTPV